MTINSLINFGIPSIRRPSQRATDRAETILARWAMVSAPPGMTVQDIRKLVMTFAFELDAFAAESPDDD